MKIVCNREGLLAACQLASVAVAGRDVKPILRNIKAIAKGAGCTLMATDLEIGVRIEVRSIKVDTAGEAILPAARLISILREASDEELTIEADKNATWVRGATNEFEMPGEDPAEFPDIPSFSEEKYHELDAKGLREMIRRTVFATAKESPRYSMTGVLWELEGNQTKLVATDGRRLAVTVGTGTSKGGHDTKGQTHVIPTKAMTLLERILVEDDQALKVSLKPNEALFKTDRAMIYTRLVEGRFPNYGEVVPKKASAKVPLTAGPFLSAVRQAAIMCDDESKKVQFSFTGKKLTLQAKATESGRSKIELPIDFDGKDTSISFDSQFLTDMLRVLSPDTALILEMTDAEKPALFRAGPEYFYVLMPIT